MSRGPEFFVFALLVFLRISIPLACTFGLCYFLRRLDRRWEEEAQAQLASTRTAAAIGPEPGKSLPCWLIKGCGEERYQSCAAYGNRSLPCWLARLRVEGRIPQTCANCSLFRTATGTHA